MTLVKNNEYACLVMARLEVLFEEYPEGFAKHCEDRDDQANLFGECFTKELDISRGRFKRTFDLIGVRYHSFVEYLQATDKFQGKYYCSIIIPAPKHRTYYRRNNAVIDLELTALINSEDLGLKA